MPTPPQGIFHFPGLADYLTVDFPFCAHGVEASVISVATYPESISSLQREGAAVFDYLGVQRSFRDCIVAPPSMGLGSSGSTVILRIKDHRWRWQFGAVSASLNRRIGKKIKSESKMSARDIAERLLKAAGEKRYDLGAIPGNDYPEFESTGAVPPMALLDDMIRKYGLRVCWLPEDMAVKIVTPGQGANLPVNEFVVNPSVSVNCGETPNRLTVTGAPLILQCKWKLKAIGKDTDGNWKEIDKLSYKPSGGWGNEYPHSFTGISDLKARKLALRTVYRVYEIERTLDSGDRDKDLAPWIGEHVYDADGEPVKVTKIEQVAPIFGELSEDETDPATGAERKKSASIRGTWFEWEPRTADDEQNTPDDDTDYEGGFSIDGERCRVIFSEPMIRYDTDNKSSPIKPADINLECTFGVRPDLKSDYIRPTWEVRLTDSNAGRKVVERPSLKRVIKFDKDSGVDDNNSEFSAEARRVTAEIVRTLQPKVASVATYQRIEPVIPDGAIQQIVYRTGAGSGGTSTTVSRNYEAAPYVERHEARRRRVRQNVELEQ